MAPLHTGGNQFPSQMNFQPIRPIMTGPSSFQNSNMGFTSTLQPSTAPTSSQVKFKVSRIVFRDRMPLSIIKYRLFLEEHPFKNKMN